MEVMTIRDLMAAAQACTTKDEARELVRQQANESVWHASRHAG
jgi:hypothetical protein